MYRFLTIITLLAAALCAAALSAQPTLEHTYPFEAYRYQISGMERYVRVPYQENGSWKVAMYDGAHQLVNTVTLDLPVTLSGNDDLLFLEGSTDFFDNDPGIEMILEADYSSFGVSTDYFIMDDDGSLLFTPLSSKPHLLNLSDGTKKVAVSDTIRTVPSFEIEHVFGIDGFGLTNLEQFGDKYYQKSDAELIFFNLDYSVFRIIPLGADFINYGYIRIHGQYALNGDDAIEWSIVTTTGGTQRVSRIFSDTTLLSTHSINAGLFELGTDLLLPTAGSGLNGPKSVLRNTGIGSMSVANALTGNIEFESSARWRFGESFGDGMKFFQYGPPTGADSITVLNADYTPWTGLKWNPLNTRVLGTYAGIFDTDPATKEILVERDNFTDKRAYLFSAGGTPFFSFPQLNLCRTIALSRIVNAPNKLLMSGINKTNVFALPSNGPVSGMATPKTPSLTVAVQPNPFVGSTIVDLSSIATPTASLLVMDNMGRVALASHQVAAGGQYNLQGLEQLPAGMYWLRVTDEAGQYGWTKIIKQ